MIGFGLKLDLTDQIKSDHIKLTWFEKKPLSFDLILKLEGTCKTLNGAQYQCDLTLTIGNSEIVDFR